jgi:hypothetical protein
MLCLMPPYDPRLCPDLERALPGDAVRSGDDGYRPAGAVCEVMFGDGGWRDVTLVSWRRDRLGRWVAQLEWHAQGGTWTESYLYDPQRVREG